MRTQTSGQAARRGDAAHGPAKGWPHGLVLALLAAGGAVGLALWGKWGFLVAFDAIRTYCF